LGRRPPAAVLRALGVAAPFLRPYLFFLLLLLAVMAAVVSQACLAAE
jgi:hypothetical protein